MNCGECGNVTAPGVGFPNHVYCKRFLLHMEKQEDASRCRYFIPKPITNADRIRAMTDEELAEKIGESIDCEVCKTMHHSENSECPSKPHQACVDFWLDWLRQEVQT